MINSGPEIYYKMGAKCGRGRKHVLLFAQELSE